MNSVSRLLAGIITASAFVLLLAASVSAAEVGVATKEGIGKYLTDGKGATLYQFSKDSEGKSACSGPCAEKWPVFHTDTVTGVTGLNDSDFGTITREDGKKQTTYKGHPLYYFFKDGKPSDTNGNGVNNVWHVVTP